MFVLAFLFLSCFYSSGADILGTPSIECLPTGIKASINMSQPFVGKIYLRGYYDQEGCFRDFSKSSAMSTESTFNFDDCHMRRKREANPSGLVMSAVMVVSHHPRLVTHRDTAFEIQCFYREQQDFATVIYDVNVESDSVSPHPMQIEPALPNCDYRVEFGNSSIVSNNSIVSVGDEVKHIWTCGNDAPNTVYCMQVHSCTAESGSNQTVPVVDVRGCISDEELLSPVTYTSSLRAVATARAFKFPARSEIRFACQIRLSLRRQHKDGKCPIPECSDVKRRIRRSVSVGRSVDVETQQVTVLEDRVYFTAPTPVPKCSWLNNPLIVISSVFFAYFVLTFCLWINSERRNSREINVRF